MTSTGTRKRAHDPEDDGRNALLGGGSGNHFATDRTNKHQNKRLKLSTPTPQSPTEDATMYSMATVGEGLCDSSIGSASWQGLSGAMPMNRSVAANSFAGLTSPPLSPASIQPPTLPIQSKHFIPDAGIHQQPAHDSVGPRIVRFDPVPDERDESDEDDGDDEPYDPEEVASVMGSEDDEEVKGEDRTVVGQVTPLSTLGQQPLPTMNALLHEIHFSNRRERLDRLALDHSRPLHVSRSALSPKHAPTELSVPNTLSPSIISPRATPLVESAMAAAMEAAAVRRESKLRNPLANGVTGIIAQPLPLLASDEQSSVGLQYEETNRYDSVPHNPASGAIGTDVYFRLLGALFLSRRKRRDGEPNL